jgi:hypothetical protein
LTGLFPARDFRSTQIAIRKRNPIYTQKTESTESEWSMGSSHFSESTCLVSEPDSSVLLTRNFTRINSVQVANRKINIVFRRWRSEKVTIGQLKRTILMKNRRR